MRLLSKLPADPTSMVLGSISLGLVIFGCCMSFLAPLAWLIALVLGIIGLVMANNSRREFYANPESYDFRTLNNVRNGKIICIIGVAVNGLLLLATIMTLIFLGSNLSEEFFKKYNNKTVHYEIGKDTIYDDLGTVDSIRIDTVRIDTSTTVVIEPTK
jgi:hypothetical protein